MIGRDVDAAAAELVVEKPGAWNRATVLHGRLELPVACGVESEAREVVAGTVCCVFSICNCAGGINVDSHGDADCSVDGVAGSLGNIGDIAAEDIAALYVAARGTCRR